MVVTHCINGQFALLGRVTSIQINHKDVEEAKKGTSVAIKIEHEPGSQAKAYGRHFDHTDELVSRVDCFLWVCSLVCQITRRSIDVLKEAFREELSKEDVQLLARLKLLFGISNQ